MSKFEGILSIFLENNLVRALRVKFIYIIIMYCEKDTILVCWTAISVIVSKKVFSSKNSKLK